MFSDIYLSSFSFPIFALALMGSDIMYHEHQTAQQVL